MTLTVCIALLLRSGDSFDKDAKLQWKVSHTSTSITVRGRAKPSARERFVFPLQEAMLTQSTGAQPFCTRPKLEGLAIKTEFRAIHCSVVDMGGGYVFMYINVARKELCKVFVSKDYGATFVIPRVRHGKSCDNTVVLRPSPTMFFSPTRDVRVVGTNLTAIARAVFASHNPASPCYSADVAPTHDTKWLLDAPFKGLATPGVIGPGSRAFGSADGVFWSHVPGVAISTPGVKVPSLGYNDGLWSLVWDRTIASYRVYLRCNYDMGVRSVMSAVSDGLDLGNWSIPKEIGLPWTDGVRGKWEEYYAMQVVGWEGVAGFQGFASRMVKSGEVPKTQREIELQGILTQDVAPVSTFGGDFATILCGAREAYLNESNVPNAASTPRGGAQAGRYATFVVRGIVDAPPLQYFWIQSSAHLNGQIYRYSVPYQRLGGMRATKHTRLKTRLLTLPSGIREMTIAVDGASPKVGLFAPDGKAIPGYEMAALGPYRLVLRGGHEHRIVCWGEECSIAPLANTACSVVIEFDRGVVYSVSLW